MAPTPTIQPSRSLLSSLDCSILKSHPDFLFSSHKTKDVNSVHHLAHSGSDRMVDFIERVPD